MNTPLLKTLVLGGLASFGFAQAASADAIIDFGPATAGPGGDTSVAVYADNIPGGTIIAGYDVLVTFASTLTLDGTTPVVYNDAAFENLALDPGVTPIDSSQTAADSIEPNSTSLLSDASDFPTSNDGVHNQTGGVGSVELFTLEFSANVTGALDDVSSLAGTACYNGGTTELIDATAAANIIPACAGSGGGSSVPEPTTLYLLGISLVGVAGLSRRRRKTP